MHIAIFCQVVDNYGDIGVCWRLARQWMADAAPDTLAVTLWVDDLVSFQRICTKVDPLLVCQRIDGVMVRSWRDAILDDANVVIEAFGCALPLQVEAQMQQVKPVWINLEYLSAEDWVESCHACASPQVSGLTRFFFFPGFTAKTGGLLAERGLVPARDAFQQADSAAQAAWWQQLGWPQRPQALVVSLFCYPHAPLANLFDAWAQADHAVLCQVPESIAVAAIHHYFQSEGELAAGRRLSRGALTLQIIPFVDQPGYDCLLWASDLNFVRGEDSFVRAQWAARPFVWHIYPQQEETHLEKLQAFMQRYTAALPAALVQMLNRFALAWNRGEPEVLAALWPQLVLQLPLLRQHARDWAQNLAQNGNLADNLLQFIQKID